MRVVWERVIILAVRPIRAATLFSMEIYSSTIISLESELICVQ